MAKLKKRQRDILAALQALGGTATTREIAAKTGLHVNGVAQSLGALYQYVKGDNSPAGARRWWYVADKAGS